MLLWSLKHLEKRRHKGGQVIINEPTSTQEIISSPFIKKSFEDAGCLSFFQKIEQLRFHDQMTSAFATKLRRDKVTIPRVDFTVWRKIISIATWIPNTREIWFKKRDIDLQSYKMYLKTPYKTSPKHVFPFRHLLDRYAPIMKWIMKYFTCEGRYSRLYQCNMRFLMHFIGVKQLNLPYYLYRSLTKMTEKVQNMG